MFVHFSSNYYGRKVYLVVGDGDAEAEAIGVSFPGISKVRCQLLFDIVLVASFYGNSVICLSRKADRQDIVF